MPTPRLRPAALSLALLPLGPAALAQTPPQAAPPRVRLQVDFVTTSAIDVNDLLPPPSSAMGVPSCLAGVPADRAYRTLGRIGDRLIHCPPDTAASGVRADIRFDARLLDGIPEAGLPEMFLHPLPRPLNAGLTVIPRVNADGSVTLTLTPYAALPPTMALWGGNTVRQTVRSGERIVIYGLPIHRGRPDDDQDALIFVMPTVVGDDALRAKMKRPTPPKVDTGQPDPPVAGVQDTPAEARRKVSLEVSDAGFNTVFGTFARQTGLEIVVRPGGTLYRPVHVHLVDATPAQALRAVARSAGAKITRDKGGTYVFAPSPTPGPAAPVTGDGSAHSARTVRVLDPWQEQVRLETLLIAVPARRVTPDLADMGADGLLAALLQGAKLVIPTPAQTFSFTPGRGGTAAFTYPLPLGRGTPARCVIRVTPRPGAEDALALGVGSVGTPTPQALRSGELTVREVASPHVSPDVRLFFFLRLVLTPDGSGQGVTVTP